MSEEWPVSLMTLLTRHFVFMRQVTIRSQGNVSFYVWAEYLVTIISAFIPLNLSGYICATCFTHTIKLCILLTEHIYVFHMVLRINTDFLLWH
jgi:hypothetical protein